MSDLYQSKNVISEGEADYVAEITNYIKEGQYSIGSVNTGNGLETAVLVLSNDENERLENLTAVQEYLPKISELLGLSYSRSILFVYPGLKGLGGGAYFDMIETSTAKAVPHELTHVLYEFSNDTDFSHPMPTPFWFTEGLADFVHTYVVGNDNLVDMAYGSLTARIQGGLLEDQPLSRIELKEAGKNQLFYDLSFRFFAEFKNLVGYDSFWDAVRHVHDVKVARSAVVNGEALTNADIEDILNDHVPQDKLGGFEQLYRTRVYGAVHP